MFFFQNGETLDRQGFLVFRLYALNATACGRADAVLTFESQRLMNPSDRHQNVGPTIKATCCVNGTGRLCVCIFAWPLHLASSEPCQKPRHSFFTLIPFLFHSWITQNGSTSVHGRNVPCCSTFQVLSAVTVFWDAMLCSLIHRNQYRTA